MIKFEWVRIDGYQTGFSTMGSTSFPPENTLLSSVVISTSGCCWSSSVSEASVTEAHPKERATMEKRAIMDLSDFMVVVVFLLNFRLSTRVYS